MGDLTPSRSGAFAERHQLGHGRYSLGNDDDLAPVCCLNKLRQLRLGFVDVYLHGICALTKDDQI